MSYIKNLESLVSGYPFGSVIFVDANGTPIYNPLFNYSSNTLFTVDNFRFNVGQVLNEALDGGMLTYSYSSDTFSVEPLSGQTFPQIYHNGIVENNFDIKLGGSLDENTLILGDNAYSLQFSGLTNYQVKSNSFASFQNSNFYARSSGTTVLYGNYGLSGETSLSLINNFIDFESYIVRQLGTGAFRVPIGNTSQQPISPYLDQGLIRYNTDLDWFEGYNGVDWFPFGVDYVFQNGLTVLSGITIELGGNLLKDTSISGGAYGLTVSRSGTGAAITGQNTTGYGVYGISTSNSGVYAQSSSNDGLYATSNTGLAIHANTTGGSNYGAQISAIGNAAICSVTEPTSTDTVFTNILLRRYSQGTAANGIGLGIDMELETDSSEGRSSRIVSKWSDATHATRTSTFEIYGVNSSVEARKMGIAGSGRITFDSYGSGIFTGTTTNLLGVDASGNITEQNVNLYSFQNGLTLTGTIVELGGSLIKDTTITSSYQLTLQANLAATGSKYPLNVINSNASGGGIYASSNQNITIYGLNGSNGVGVRGESSSGYGVFARSSTGYGIYAYSTSGIPGLFQDFSSDSNGVREMIRINRVTSAAGSSNGIGGELTFHIETSANVSYIANSIRSKWTDATDATRTSQFQITGTKNAANAVILSLDGDGLLTLNKYGTGTFTGTTDTFLTVSATGEVIEKDITNTVTTLPIIKTTVDYTATTDNYTIIINASGGTVDVELPDPSLVEGRIYNIKAIDISNAATVSTPSGNIDASGTFTFTSQYERITVQSNGLNWYIIS